LIDKLVKTCEVETDGRGAQVLPSWEEIKEMHRGGIKFGAHSVNHPRLTDISLESAKNEIVKSKHDIEEKLGIETTSFSYPYGGHDSRIINLVKEAGFKCGVTSLIPYRMVGTEDDVHCLQRIPGVSDFNKLKGMLSGLVGDVQKYVTKGNPILVAR
jgi:peptidoglycan/xylan/chitin deacetylase (PgdA/CDA1 family)